MAVRIIDDVSDGAHQLGGSAQQPRVVVVGEDAARARHRGIEGLRDPNGEALHALGKRSAVVRLDDEVQVIAEHAEFDQAQSEPAARRCEAPADARVSA